MCKNMRISLLVQCVYMLPISCEGDLTFHIYLKNGDDFVQVSEVFNGLLDRPQLPRLRVALRQLGVSQSRPLLHIHTTLIDTHTYKNKILLHTYMHTFRGHSMKIARSCHTYKHSYTYILCIHIKILKKYGD